MAALPLTRIAAPKVPCPTSPPLPAPRPIIPWWWASPTGGRYTLFTPVSGMNFDSVGYASVGGPNVGVSAAHHTLPLPCYVEVTSLASGAPSWCGWNGAGRWTAPTPSNFRPQPLSSLA
jgi:hypothetical protein